MPTVRLLFLLLAAMLLAAKAAPSDQVDECLDVDYAVKQCAPGLPARLTASAPPVFADRAARAVQTRRAARAAATKSRGDGANQSQHFAALRPTNSASACAACARCSDSDPRSRLSWQGSLQRSRHTGEE